MAATYRITTFICLPMHSIIQNLEVKIYVVQKFKRHKIKNHFQHVSDRLWSIIREYRSVLDWNYP